MKYIYEVPRCLLTEDLYPQDIKEEAEKIRNQCAGRKQFKLICANLRL